MTELQGVPADRPIDQRVSDALERARPRLRHVIDTAPIALAILSGEELRYQYVNRTYRRLRPRGTVFEGMRFRDLFPIRSGRGAERPIREVLRTGRPWRIHDFRASLEERTTTWWEGECLPLENERGIIDSVLMLTWEVTDRHEAEEALRRSEARFRDVFEHAGVSVWLEDFTDVKAELDNLAQSGVADLRGYLDSHPEFVKQAIRLVRVTDVNEASLELFGADTKQDLTASLANSFTAATESVFIDELVALAGGEPVVRREVAMMGVDGRHIDAICTVRFDHEEQRYDEVIVTVSDVTQRKRAETALRASEERYRVVVENQTEMLCRFRMDGTIVFANRAYARTLATTSEALLGTNFWDKNPGRRSLRVRGPARRSHPSAELLARRMPLRSGGSHALDPLGMPGA